MTDTPAPYVRPDVRMFLDYLNALPGPKTHELSPPEARAMMVAMRAVAEVDTGELAVIRNLSCPGLAGPIPMRLFDARAEREAGPVMVFFHGGGWVIGDLDTHEPFCAEAARQLDMPVISVDYRLAPENPWPAAPDDCEAAARWIASNPAEMGVTATGLVIAGDSAGGNLTIITAMALRDEPAEVPVIAQFPIYPATEMGEDRPSYKQFSDGHLLTHEGMQWFTAQYAADESHHRASPLVESQEGMPPTIVMTASLDPIRDQGRAYAAALIEAGVPTIYREAKGTIHGFIGLRKAMPSGVLDVTLALKALKSVIEEVVAEKARG